MLQPHVRTTRTPTPPPPQFSGKFLELANQHTASRVIQFCLKEGSPEAKGAITKEVKGHAVELAKSRYGHYLVSKVVGGAKKDEIPGALCAWVCFGGVLSCRFAWW